MNCQITVEKARDRIHYCPESGLFTWKLDIGRAKAGSVAGRINDEGYVSIFLCRKRRRAHRLAWLLMRGEFPGGDIDHINGDRSDNRWVNLRIVTRSENQKNQSMHSNNTSGVNGVYWCKNRKKWHARIVADGKTSTIGFYADLSEAADARRNAEKENGFHENHASPSKQKMFYHRAKVRELKKSNQEEIA
jgi:hypothetical protein